MAITKPTVDSATWGNTNTSSPDQVTPGAGLINTGFLAYPTKLKRGHLNWLIGKLHQGMRYMLAQGLPAWDASETNYIVGSFVMFGGLGYRLKTASPAGTDPTVDTTHWELMVPVPSGLLLAERVITVSGSYASTAGTKRATFRMCGMGGGGLGGWDTGGPGRDGESGGAGGSWGEFSTTVIPANWVVTLATGGGVGGAAGAAPADYHAGTDGGSAIFSDGTNTFTCPGGGGAKTTTLFLGGAPGAMPTAAPGGTILFASQGQRGGDGTHADVANQVTVMSGKGGDCGPFGDGGASRQHDGSTAASLPGHDGTGYGSGGSGCATHSSIGGAKGGDGRPQIVILREWS